MFKKILAKILLSCVGLLFLVIFTGRIYAVNDRLVMEVNGVHYTQLQVESYTFIRALLNANSKINLPNVDNWKQFLLAFEAFVLLEQEANRIGGYQPSQGMLDKTIERVDNKIQQDQSLILYAKKIGLSKSQLQRVVQSLLLIESLRRSRTNRLGGDGETFNTNIQKEDATLIQDLKSKAFIRYYEGSTDFKILEAFPS